MHMVGGGGERRREEGDKESDGSKEVKVLILQLGLFEVLEIKI